MTGLFIFLIVTPLIAVLIWRSKKPALNNIVLPDNIPALLQQHVAFYNKLDAADKIKFEERIKEFLLHTRITGVKTDITTLDKMLVAASAIIPVFGFNWHYYNLTDVLLYDGTFNADDFAQTKDSNVLGMVGSGVMQRMMILSKAALRQGFANEISRSNTGIHEFVHLLDKADGDTDGVPEALLSRQYTIPWLKYMSEEIEKIKDGKSDINIYGATNKAEFFAVASEYFFGAPEKFKEKHPALFDIMTKIFHV